MALSPPTGEGEKDMKDHRACHCCGQIHRLPEARGHRLLCTRCGTAIPVPGDAARSSARTAAITAGALAAVAVVASLIPARRVLRVDVSLALRGAT